MKTALKIKIKHNCSKIKQTKNKQKKKDKLKSTKQQTGLQKNNNNNNKKKNQKKNQQQEQQKTNKQTVALEFGTLDCSFTHVLQAPNTQPYQS